MPKQKPVTEKSPEWTKPTLTFDSDLEDLVLGGGGKLSSSGGDGGESRKQPPTG